MSECGGEWGFEISFFPSYFLPAIMILRSVLRCAVVAYILKKRFFLVNFIWAPKFSSYSILTSDRSLKPILIPAVEERAS